MMKRILLLILLFSVMAVSLSYAADFTIAVDKVVENGIVNHTVIIKGNTSDKLPSLVGLVIRNSANEVKVLKQISASSDGSFSFEIPLNIADTYTASINTKKENVKVPKEFKILSSGEYDSIIAPFNASDATWESYIENIELSKSELGVDTKYYGEFSEQIAKILIKEKGTFTIGNFLEKFNLASLMSVLSGDNTALMKEAVRYYDAQFGLISDEATSKLYNAVSDLAASETVLKSVFNTATASHYTSFESLRDGCEKQLITKPYELLNIDELDIFIRNTLSVYKFPDYEELTTAKLQSILSQLKANKNLSTSEEYLAFYNAIYNQNLNQSTGGVIGGGGGGGGGAGTSYTPPAKVEAEEPEKEDSKEIQATPVNFNDLGNVPWAEAAIEKLVEKKIVNGKTAETFCPNDKITRAEFVKLIVCLFECHDSSAKSKFSDIDEDDWYNSYVASAVANSIINGRANNTFGGNECIKREDMAVMLYRAIISFKALEETTSLENNIADFAQVSEYAKNSVLMLSNMKIISGKGNGIFDPKANATRAEACVMINNLLEGME